LSEILSDSSDPLQQVSALAHIGQGHQSKSQLNFQRIDGEELLNGFLTGLGCIFGSRFIGCGFHTREGCRSLGQCPPQGKKETGSAQQENRREPGHQGHKSHRNGGEEDGASLQHQLLTKRSPKVFPGGRTGHQQCRRGRENQGRHL